MPPSFLTITSPNLVLVAGIIPNCANVLLPVNVTPLMLGLFVS